MAAEDDVKESWEDTDTEELERRMEERQKQLIEEKKVLKTEPTGGSAGNALPSSLTAATHDLHPPLRMQDSDRTEYVPPIKILRRQPDQQSSAEQAATPTTATASKVTTKSLAEREAEYASARARILGSVYPTPEDNGTSTKKVVAKGNEQMAETSLRRQPKGPDGTCGFQHLS